MPAIFTEGEKERADDRFLFSLFSLSLFSSFFVLL